MNRVGRRFGGMVGLFLFRSIIIQLKLDWLAHSLSDIFFIELPLRNSRDHCVSEFLICSFDDHNLCWPTIRADYEIHDNGLRLPFRSLVSGGCQGTD